MRFPAAVLGMAAALLLVPPAARAGEEAAKALKVLEAGVAASTTGTKETYLAYKPGYEAFADQYRGTEEALTAKLWLLRNTWWHRDEGTMEKKAAALADEILAQYPDSEQLAKIPDCHFDFAAADRDRILGVLAEKSKHAAVRGSALLRLALAAKGDRKKEILERLVKEYAEVPHHFTTVGAMAAAHLSPHAAADLAVGMMAPEIEGRTREGKPMRLSDNRGKVVVIDFFGDW